MSTECARRIERLRALLSERGVEALLVTHLPNIRYLAGFTGSAGALLVEERRSTLFTDGRYGQQAGMEVRVAHVDCAAGAILTRAAQRLKAVTIGRAGFESEHLTVEGLQTLRKNAGARIRLCGVRGLVEGLRAVKSPREVEAIRQAAKVTAEVFSQVLPLVEPGVRELELAAEIDYQMRRLGGAGPAFETIVTSGPRSALPHARPTAKRLRKNELVVLDLGVILHGYASDVTRTFYLGSACGRIRKWYAAVREAQRATIAGLRAGLTGGQADGLARDILKRHRLDKAFIHSTGHGLGLEIHEEPRLAPGQGQRLVAGNVVTVEPGVYVCGLGGIRIEDDVLVKPAGSEILSQGLPDSFEL
jgi:Xaa-Pro aminopeptidase